MTEIIFYVFAGFAVVSATLCILQRSPISAALWLVSTMFSLAAIYVLLDAQDWMTDAQLNALWSEIDRTAAAGARVIFRTAAEESVIEGRVGQHLLRRWSYLADRSRELNLRDRSAIYGGFHIYELRG